MLDRNSVDGKDSSFCDRLEARARWLINSQQEGRHGSPMTRALMEEIAFVLDQLDSVRAVHERQRRSLLRTECYIDTELMQMEARTPRYSPHRFPEREKMHRRLQLLETERRRLFSQHDLEKRDLQSRLLALVNKHGQLAQYAKSGD